MVKDEVDKMIVEKVAVMEVESCCGKPVEAETEIFAGKLVAQDPDGAEDQKVEDEVQEVVEDEDVGEVQLVEKDRQVSVEGQ